MCCEEVSFCPVALRGLETWNIDASKLELWIDLYISLLKDGILYFFSLRRFSKLFNTSITYYACCRCIALRESDHRWLISVKVELNTLKLCDIMLLLVSITCFDDMLCTKTVLWYAFVH